MMANEGWACQQALPFSLAHASLGFADPLFEIDTTTRYAARGIHGNATIDGNAKHLRQMRRDAPRDNTEGIGTDRSSARDVARLAGVSTATVSRALNLPRAVDPATLLRVQAAIDKLRYVPHGAARALRSQRSAMIGAVVPSFDYALYARTTSALQREADARGRAPPDLVDLGRRERAGITSLHGGPSMRRHLGCILRRCVMQFTLRSLPRHTRKYFDNPLALLARRIKSLPLRSGGPRDGNRAL